MLGCGGERVLYLLYSYLHRETKQPQIIRHLVPWSVRLLCVLRLCQSVSPPFSHFSVSFCLPLPLSLASFLLLCPVVLLIPILISHENFLCNPKWEFVLGQDLVLRLERVPFLCFLLSSFFCPQLLSFMLETFLLFMSCRIVSWPVVSCPILSRSVVLSYLSPPALAVNDNNSPHRTKHCALWCESCN